MLVRTTKAKTQGTTQERVFPLQRFSAVVLRRVLLVVLQSTLKLEKERGKR